MKKRFGMLMDPIGSIHVEKDSSFALLLAAQRRGWTLFYMNLTDLFLMDQRVWGRMRTVEVRDDPQDWYRFTGELIQPCDRLDLLFMRKDPPVDREYLHTTYLLERVAAAGTRVVNHPKALRDANEKLFALEFPDCVPPTLVSARADRILAFLQQEKDLILKPLDNMGGSGIFRVRQGDPNTNVILETLTRRGQSFCLAQRFLPEIAQGDKRILLVGGQPVPFALARIPKAGETRGNLAAGGRGEGRPLTERDRWIAQQVGPTLLRRGIYFAGLDVIGDFLTEINITSPTCIRELDAQYGLDIAGDLLAYLEAQ